MLKTKGYAVKSIELLGGSFIKDTPLVFLQV